MKRRGRFVDVDAVRPGEDLPDWSEALLGAGPGEEWVVVHRDYGTHKRVEITFAMLIAAGIPAWLKAEPFAPRFGSEAQILWGDLLPIPVLVPESRAEEARLLLGAPFEDPGGELASAGEELEALRHGNSWPVWVLRLFRAYAVLSIAAMALSIAYGVTMLVADS